MPIQGGGKKNDNISLQEMLLAGQENPKLPI